MKKKVFFIIVLVILFVFGILIYDFSDEMDMLITSHNWYWGNNNEIYVLSLNNNKFKLINENGNKLNEYSLCENYHYNSNISMIKLNCNGTDKRLYVSGFDDNKLILNDDGIERIFYKNKELALVENFKQENNLSDSEYSKLLSINFNEKLLINYKKFLSLYKGKNIVYIGLISNDINYENVYNYHVLNNLISNSTKDFYLINMDNLNENELNKLNKITRQDNYSNKIYIYEVKNKTINLKLEVDALNKNDLNKYQSI